MRRAVVALLALGIGCTAPPRTLPAPATAAPPIGDVTAEELRRDLYAFADDSMHGRETGTEDATRAMRFLIERLTRLGLEPAGDSGFAQRVPMQKEVFGPGTQISVEQNGNTRPVKLGTEIVPLLNLGAGVPPTKRTAVGEIVFVGFGIAHPRNRPFDSHLDLEREPVKAERGKWPREELAALPALVVGIEDESAFVGSLEEKHARGRLAVVANGREAERRGIWEKRAINRLRLAQQVEEAFDGILHQRRMGVGPVATIIDPLSPIGG